MKTQDKILLHAGLPAAVRAALAEQLGDAATGDAAAEAALGLVLAGPETPAADLAAYSRQAVPVLVLAQKSGLRLGRLLRQVQHILDRPVLYLEDVPLGPCLFQPQEKNISCEAGDVALTDKEVEILAYLLRHQRRTVGREDLLRHVWRYQTGVDTHTLETHIYRLRQKMSAIPALRDMLVTDEDGGYRVQPPACA